MSPSKALLGFFATAVVIIPLITVSPAYAGEPDDLSSDTTPSVDQAAPEVPGFEDAGTITFSVDGRAYEIDLSADNAQSLREAFSPYVSAGRTVKAGVRGSTSRSRSGSSSRDLAAVRAWASDNGDTVSPRGHVPAQVIEADDNAS